LNLERGAHGAVEQDDALAKGGEVVRAAVE
jgi:hypothetical protein